MRLYAVETAASGDVATPGDAARDGRAAAMSRRRALAAGRSAPAPERVRTGCREVEQSGPPAAADATGGVADAHLGRALSMQRRRQLARGKRALSPDGDHTAAAAGARVFVVHRGGAG